MKLEWKPESRREGKVAVELGAEVVIYELDRDRATALNPLAAYLWRNASGDVALAQLARGAGSELSSEVEPDVVCAAAEELAEAGLLTSPPARSFGGVQRREVLRRMAFSAPLLTTLIVPPPVAAASGTPRPPLPFGDRSASTDGSTVGGVVGGAAVAASALVPTGSTVWRPIPLIPFANRSLGDCELASFTWPRSRAERDRTGLERVPFAVREGVLCLAGKMAPGLPQQVSGIPVGLRFDHLFLLHGAMGQRAYVGDFVGRYVARYDDGDSAVIPVQYGLDVAVEGDDRPLRLRSRRIEGGRVPVFGSVWKNPRPEALVTAIDFESAMAPAGPICIALTASSSRRHNSTWNANGRNATRRNATRRNAASA